MAKNNKKQARMNLQLSNQNLPKKNHAATNSKKSSRTVIQS